MSYKAIPNTTRQIINYFIMIWSNIRQYIAKYKSSMFVGLSVPENKSRSSFGIIYFATNTKKTQTIHSEIRQLFLLSKCLLSEKIIY